MGYKKKKKIVYERKEGNKVSEKLYNNKEDGNGQRQSVQ